MTEETFWEQIEKARAAAKSKREMVSALERALGELPLEDILDFSMWTAKFIAKASDRRLAVAGAVMRGVLGALGDDGFVYFKAWLIAQGKEVYERALMDPDSLADVQNLDEGVIGPMPYLEEFLYVTLKPFAEKSGGKTPSAYR